MFGLHMVTLVRYHATLNIITHSWIFIYKIKELHKEFHAIPYNADRYSDL